eukprot:747437-Hanusia_phi.AAC.2
MGQYFRGTIPRHQALSRDQTCQTPPSHGTRARYWRRPADLASEDTGLRVRETCIGLKQMFRCNRVKPDKQRTNVVGSVKCQ